MPHQLPDRCEKCGEPLERIECATAGPDRIVTRIQCPEHFGAEHHQQIPSEHTLWIEMPNGELWRVFGPD